MSATAHPASTSEARRPAGALLAFAERGMLALRMTLAMVAAGLLVLAVLWQLIAPGQRALSDLVAGAAALLVAVPVIGAAWDSLHHPSLHGVTDRLISVALVAAWASGDLMTAAVLPIIMIVGHVLEERSLLGSREAIQALGRLTETHARRLHPDGTSTIVAAAEHALARPHLAVSLSTVAISVRQHRAVQRLAGIADVVRHDAHGAHRPGDIARREIAGDCVEELPYPEWE